MLATLGCAALSLAAVPYVPSAQLLGSESRVLAEPNGSTTQLFGGSVACTRHSSAPAVGVAGGYTVVVGAPGDDGSGATDAGAAYVYENGAATSAFPLARSTGFAAGDHFGQVAVDRDTLVATAWKDDGALVDVGSLSVYERQPIPGSPGFQWTEARTFDFADATLFVTGAGDSIGSVDLEGETLVVGGRSAMGGGKAWAIEKGTGWAAAGPAQVAPLVAVSPNATLPGDDFGCAVAIDGNRAAVGARRKDFLPCPGVVTSGCDQGAVYLFERTQPGTWVQTQILQARDPVSMLPEGSNADEFGFSVDLFGDTLVVGAPSRDVDCLNESQEPNCDNGTVYVYELDPNTQQFLPVARLTPAGVFLKADEFLAGSGGTTVPNRPTTFERFGYSVALHGSRIVVGAPGRFLYPGDLSTLNTGAAYVFERRSDGVWRRTRFFTSESAGDPAQSGSWFGASVDASENLIAIGSALASAGGELLSGRAYSFYLLPEFSKSAPAFQVTEHESVCFGDGVCPSCPCANDGPPSTVGGCLNSSGTSGRLVLSGSASLSEDTLRVEGVGMSPSVTAVLFYSPTPFSTAGCLPTSGVQFPMLLDGLRCLDSAIRGPSRATDALGTLGIRTRGIGPPADGPPGGLMAQIGATLGSVQYFQIFYRNGVSGACTTMVNTTNAVRTTIRP